MHAVSEAREHLGITGQNNVGVEVLPEVNITLQDEAIEGVADAYSGKTQITGMTESLSAQEPLLANGDHLAAGPQPTGLLQRVGRGGGLHLLLEVKSNIAELLLDVTINLPLSCGI